MDYIWQFLGVEYKQWRKLCEVLWTRIFKSEDILSALSDEEVE